MKIAMIFFSLNVAGGSASVFLSLANALQKKGCQIDVYCYYYDPKKCFPELAESLNINYVKLINEKGSRLNNQSLANRLRLAIDYYFKALILYGLMENKKYDLVFASEACAYIPALAYKKRHKTPVCWSVFDPISLIDEKKPGLLINRYQWFKYLLKIHNLFDSRKIREIDKVIVPTSKMKRDLDKFYKIESETMPLAGVNSAVYEKDQKELIVRKLKDEFGFEKANETILFSLGHFLPHRRYEDILLAMDLLIKNGFKNFKFIISGSQDFDPAYFSHLKDLIYKLNLESYVILDESFKTAKEVIGYYQYCDIFLFVSTEQTWGLAPFEALISGKPIVISKGVGCSEVFKDKENAIIVDEKSPEQIASAIKLLKDRNLYFSLTNQGRIFVRENFTYDKIACELERLFKNIIGTQCQN
ncbi:glycosyltransferase family 4 protein [Candidatus Parcubacteria bacterium]|nr:glycosyltransferase family 4 protein [Patescibacteria group bacterium]MBU4466989.1 glycosyltransferase family 4 protein [Patescibacteria group bacterium]MCG2688308.1 glycosyltransferase family 4 protein [Candidatus Parcubacteria bacterium]